MPSSMHNTNQLRRIPIKGRESQIVVARPGMSTATSCCAFDHQIDPYVASRLLAEHDSVDIGLADFGDSCRATCGTHYHRIDPCRECLESSRSIQPSVTVLGMKAVVIDHVTNRRGRLPKNVANLLGRKNRVVGQKASAAHSAANGAAADVPVMTPAGVSV